MTEQDRQTIGLSPDSQALLEEIQRKDWFEDAQDIARFALAHAIALEEPPGVTAGAETRWAVSGFDKSGELLAIVSSLYPTDTPVRMMEHLTNRGITLLHKRLVLEGGLPSDLLV